MKKIYTTLFVALAFTVQSSAHVNLLNPAGGETFFAGNVVTVQWQIAISHNIQNWDLYFSSDGGSSWDPIELNIPPTGNGAGLMVTYDWTVPSTATLQGRIRVVMDNSATDYEDQSGNFTVDLANGILDQNAKSIFSIHPNPASSGGSLNLSFAYDQIGFSSIEIRDLTGAIVKTIPVNGTTNGQMTVEMSGLRTGYYFLYLLGERGALIDRKPFVLIDQ